MIEPLQVAAFEKYAKGIGGTAVCLGDQKPSTGTGYFDSATLFRHLGFENCFTIDYNGNADLTHDLNYPLPQHLRAAAKLLYDGGTAEHVANIGQVLQSICLLTAPGGVLVQQVPLNCVGESYYGLDPMLLRDFYELNGFETLDITLFCRENMELRILERSTWMPAWLLKHWRVLLAKFAAGRALLTGCEEKWLTKYDAFSTHRNVPATTFTQYVGKRVSNPPVLVSWPHQGLYKAAPVEPLECTHGTPIGMDCWKCEAMHNVSNGPVS